MRSDAPGRLGPTKAALPDLSSAESRAAALRNLDGDVYAPTSRVKHNTLWNTALAALARWGLEPFPPTADKVRALGSALKEGNYKTADTYVGHYRVQCQRAGYTWDDDLQ